MLQCGLVSIPLGITYMADRLGDDGSEITRSIEHINLSQDLVLSTRCSKLESSATDHFPIVACTNLHICKNQTSQTSAKINYQKINEKFHKNKMVGLFEK